MGDTAQLTPTGWVWSKRTAMMCETNQLVSGNVGKPLFACVRAALPHLTTAFQHLTTASAHLTPARAHLTTARAHLTTALAPDHCQRTPDRCQRTPGRRCRAPDYRPPTPDACACRTEIRTHCWPQRTARRHEGAGGAATVRSFLDRYNPNDLVCLSHGPPTPARPPTPDRRLCMWAGLENTLVIYFGDYT